MRKKSSYSNQEKIKPNSEECLLYDDPYKIKIKMEKLLKKYFKKEPSILIYFIIEDEKNIEKYELNPIDKNKINLEIKSWKKKYTNNSLIQTFLEVIKSNNMQSQNLNQILKELNYNIINNEDIEPNEPKNKINEKNGKINNITSTTEINDNDDESSLFDNSILSIENILNINNNRDIDICKKYGMTDKDEEPESSCNAEYFESTNYLPLDEFKDIEMQSNSKDKENNNTDNMSEENSINYSKKNLSGMEFLKKKTRKQLNDKFHV